MPIQCSIETSRIDQDSFHKLDKIVMRHAFDIHNELGRFCDEIVYQDELAKRCREVSNLSAHREVLIRVCHKGFLKHYYIDMFVENAVVYELKTAEGLNATHQNQVINYLMLSDVQHGKLINFRHTSVQSRFMSTRITKDRRYELVLSTSRMALDEPSSRRLLSTLKSIIHDWGTFLDIQLYKDALDHLLQDQIAGIHPVPLFRAGRQIGTQSMHLLNETTAWHVSSIRASNQSYKRHLMRLLQLTRLGILHWINFNNQEVTIETLPNDFVQK